VFLTGTERITREQWNKLPLALRQRWWRETNFSEIEPGFALAQAIREAIDAQAGTGAIDAQAGTG
jgi:hypothetical protein